MEKAFDEVAGSYDRTFTDTPLGRRLRAIVWSRLRACFRPGDRILELNCGTGEDAIWMGRRGMTVLATDSSHGMLGQASRKISAAGLEGRVSTRVVDLNDPSLPSDTPLFDGALSNFGGLNCIEDPTPLWRLLRRFVRRGGTVVVVPMARWCPWEILWNLLRIDPQSAFRRLRASGVRAEVGGFPVQVLYPRIREWKQTAGPHFRLVRVSGMGVFLPPSYLAERGVVRKLYPLLSRLESALGGRPPFHRLGDHLILEMEHAGIPPTFGFETTSPARTSSRRFGDAEIA